MTVAAARSDRRGRLAILAIAGSWLVGETVFAAFHTPGVQLAVMLLFLLFFCASAASLIALVRGWRTSGWRAAIPLIACVAAWWLAPIVSRMVDAGIFARDLPAFEAIVARPDVQATAPGADVTVELSDKEKQVAWHVDAERTPDGTLLVTLLNGSGFPVKHSGFLYSSTGRVPPDARMNERLPYRGAMRDHWFSVSD